MNASGKINCVFFVKVAGKEEDEVRKNISFCQSSGEIVSYVTGDWIILWGDIIFTASVNKLVRLRKGSFQDNDYKTDANLEATSYYLIFQFSTHS